MALYWDWESKVGEIEHNKDYTCNRPHKHNLYTGNAFVICTTEYEDDNTYSVIWFASDKNHMKNICGLTKDYKDNLLAKYGIEKIKVDYNNNNMRELIKIIIDSKMPIEIELYDGKTPF